MSEQATAITKRPKGRSPAYPAINIETAIQRARQLYDSVRQHKVPVSTIVNYWHYKSLNGPASQTLAALVKYGLVDDEGTGPARKAGVSSRGHIILAHPDEAARKAAIREAAVRPGINRELWEQYGNDLPPDEALHWELTQTRGFTETGAKEFIPVYRATIAFAQLASRVPEDTGESDNGDDGERNDDSAEGHNTSQQERRRNRESQRAARPETAMSFPIPLVGGGVVVVEGEFPLAERDWDQFIAVLNAMKPGLVTVSPEKTPEQPGDLSL